MTLRAEERERVERRRRATSRSAAGGGRTAFYNFLSGNADGLCGNACTYSEAQNDVTEHLRFNRYEMFAQDSWKPRGQRHAWTTASATRSTRRSPTPTTS